MVNPSYDPWDSVLLSPEDTSQTIQKNQNGDAWDSLDYDEGFWKNAFRYAAQIPQSIAETTSAGIGASLWQMLGQGDTLDPEEIEHIRMISEREGIPFNEESYREAAQNALSMIPTVSNIAHAIEDKIGIPLEPKTRGQKALRFFGNAARLSPEGYGIRGTNVSLPKPILGGAVTVVKELSQELGLPEPLAEMGSFGILKKPSQGSASLSIGKSTKPSGMSNNRYEKINKPTKISESKIKQINQKVESEFRDIASDIIEKSPIHETYSNLKNDSGFKDQVRDSFKKVENLAEELPHEFSTKELKKNLLNRNLKNKKSSITASEYDKAHEKFMKEFSKETPVKSVSAADLVEQYRNNNASYSESFEPGKSKAYNRAKQDAYLEYNRTIADMIEHQFPDTEFSNLFKSTNEQWSKIMDAEAISGFIEDVFDGKIKFSEGKKFLDKEGMQKPFARALGKEGFNDFKQLTKDLLSTEEANKLLRVAEKKGFLEGSKNILTYVLNPTVGHLKLGYDVSKSAMKTAWEGLLNNPEIAIKWDKGIKDFKKGDFKSAEKIFNEIDISINKSNQK